MTRQNPITQLYRRIFCRKGFGVHSPFVFNLITTVIEEKTPYYAYRELSIQRKVVAINEREERAQIDATTRTNRPAIISQNEGELFFRLANRMEPRTFLLLGSSRGLSPLYLSAYTTKPIEGIIIEEEGAMAIEAEKIIQQRMKVSNGSPTAVTRPALQELGEIDCMLFDLVGESDLLSLFTEALPYTHDHSFFILRGIHASKAQSAAWKEITANPVVTVSIDLLSVGLLFFHHKLHKRNYKAALI